MIKRLNRKGFMMAEVIVVSAIILIFLGTIYASYNKLLGTYKTRLTYYDTTTLYELGYYRDILVENRVITETLNNAKESGHLLIYDSANNAGSIFQLPENERSYNTNEKVYMLYKENRKLNGDELDNLEVNPTFKDYIKYLSTSTQFKTTNVMVMEKCNTKTNDANDCKYSYLEVYEANEAQAVALPPPPTSTPAPTGATTYTVTYHGNGAIYGSDPWEDTAVYGENYCTPPNWYSRPGYKFNGWNEKVDSDGYGIGNAWKLTSPGVYENGNGTNPWVWTYTKNIDLYAQWCMPDALCCGGEGEGKHVNMCAGETCHGMYKGSYQCTG